MNSGFPKLYGEVEAASLLGLSRRTLQGWRLTGGGPIYRRIGRRVAYAESDLRDFIDAGSRRHTSEPC